MQYLEISRYENFSWILSFNNTIQFLELYMTKIMHCWTNNEEINMYLLEKVVRVSERLWTCIYIGNSQLDQNSILRFAHVDRHSLS